MGLYRKVVVFVRQKPYNLTSCTSHKRMQYTVLTISGCQSMEISNRQSVYAGYLQQTYLIPTP